MHKSGPICRHRLHGPFSVSGGLCFPGSKGLLRTSSPSALIETGADPEAKCKRLVVSDAAWRSMGVGRKQKFRGPRLVCIYNQGSILDNPYGGDFCNLVLR